MIVVRKHDSLSFQKKVFMYGDGSNDKYQKSYSKGNHYDWGKPQVANSIILQRDKIMNWKCIKITLQLQQGPNIYIKIITLFILVEYSWPKHHVSRGLQITADNISLIWVYKISAIVSPRTWSYLSWEMFWLKKTMQLYL